MHFELTINTGKAYQILDKGSAKGRCKNSHKSQKTAGQSNLSECKSTEHCSIYQTHQRGYGHNHIHNCGRLFGIKVKGRHALSVDQAILLQGWE